MMDDGEHSTPLCKQLVVFYVDTQDEDGLISCTECFTGKNVYGDSDFKVIEKHISSLVNTYTSVRDTRIVELNKGNVFFGRKQINDVMFRY